MALWKRSDVRDALWVARRPAAYIAPAQSSSSGLVVGRRVDPSLFDEMRERRAQEIAAMPPLRHDRPGDKVRDAWVAMVSERLGDERVCFFTGSYRDDYGYANGLMLARNVQRDFKRFLAAYGYDDCDWVCAVEKHPSGRDVLHLHALLADMGPNEMLMMEHDWTESRGWSKAVRCHDGGVRYTCKYALKGAYVETFDWSW
jgi:hypothetical protein